MKPPPVLNSRGPVEGHRARALEAEAALRFGATRVDEIGPRLMREYLERLADDLLLANVPDAERGVREYYGAIARVAEVAFDPKHRLAFKAEAAEVARRVILFAAAHLDEADVRRTVEAPR